MEGFGMQSTNSASIFTAVNGYTDHNGSIQYQPAKGGKISRHLQIGADHEIRASGCFP